MQAKKPALAAGLVGWCGRARPRARDYVTLFQ
jgi:hypothetical protein